jgi:hypothetical protein
MPTCVLCENVQPGGEACEVCGRPFPRGEAVAAEVARLAEFEPTALAAASVEPAPIRMEGLEPTASPGGGGVPPEPVDGLERTAAAAVAVVAEPLPDLEATAEAPVPGDAAPAGLGAACRYCRTPAAPGQVFCARCGMRLPAGDASRERAGEGPGEACWQCGAPALRDTCPSCGARARG